MLQNWKHYEEDIYDSAGVSNDYCKSCAKDFTDFDTPLSDEAKRCIAIALAYKMNEVSIAILSFISGVKLFKKSHLAEYLEKSMNESDMKFIMTADVIAHLSEFGE